MKIPVVKEYGSWAVFIFSCAAGIGTGLLTRPWLTERDYYVNTLLTTAGLVLLVNSKNPLVSALRTRDREQKRGHLLWFLSFALAGLFLLTPFLIEGIKTFLVFSLLILSYAILVVSGKEHSLPAELNGFALLTLPAPIVNFAVTGELSLTLYFAVLVYFTAGVFKVRAKTKKTLPYRWLMTAYCLTSPVFFYAMNISVIALVPLFENIISVWLMKEEKLRTTGNIELIKGVIFTTLLIYCWQ